MPIRFRAGAASDVGAFRTSNQDAAFTAPWGAAVADGVGGGPSGDLASAALLRRFADGAVGIPDERRLLERIRAANGDLRGHVRRDPSLQGMATTLTGAFVSLHGTVLLAHTGDSRAYLLRGGTLTRETRDDSYVQVLVERGLLTPEDAAQHPRRNLITSSLGGGDADLVSVRERDALTGDRWLLCSDGLSDYLPDTELAAILAGIRSPSGAAEAAVSLALEAGSRDNVTAVVADLVEAWDASDPHPIFFGSAAAPLDVIDALESA
ncbi:protein phosphatase 2C domain-containing protein [Microbacterium sp. X-17]|uniref:PP2C family protein-serine/threonine phosphatase n=1 Tax=Microbacterium sp. X-17 TaxID=3144404 RepID=UPI0031F5D972